MLEEDKLPAKLPVRFSNELVNKLEDIEWYNRNNTEGLFQFHDYLDGMTMWISNTSIAWDNTNHFQHHPNGSTHVRTNGYDVTYTIKINKRTNQTYVYVFDIGFDIEDFGLNNPDNIWESQNKPSKRVYRLTESQLHSIIGEVIKEILLSA